MPPSPTIHATTPSGSCPFSELPHELMTEVFLHLDPHTLYTSIRSLNHDWKETVESHIVPMAFLSGKWRIALRIHQRPRKRAQEQNSIRRNETQQERRERVESTPGAFEDELDPPSDTTAEPVTTTTYLPLELSRVNSLENKFEFSSGINWYAIYEPGPNSSTDNSFRLDLDFGIAWRFDGDGKESEEQRPGGWTKLDTENGWLSKFYCSTYDLKPSNHDTTRQVYKLNSTNLTRRRRRRMKSKLDKRLIWSDEELEYIHITMSLGTEFFIRKSARANLLMRALEVEAAKRDLEDQQQEVVIEYGDNSVNGGVQKSPWGVSQPVSPLPISPTGSKVVSNGNGHTIPPNSSRIVSNGSGSSTPTGSRTVSNGHTTHLSPAEQLQAMVKSKAAAKAAGDRTRRSKKSPSAAAAGWARTNSLRGSLLSVAGTQSQPMSRSGSRVGSLAPSRSVSGAPTRVGSPSLLAQEGDDNGISSLSLGSPLPPVTPTASPRDLPFFRAQILSLSTASPHTNRALSGYTTPLIRHRPDSSTSTPKATERGGGGTPQAEFSARLRKGNTFTDAVDPTARHKGKRKDTITTAGLPGEWIQEAPDRQFKWATEDVVQADEEMRWCWSR
ncbi:unnamed protein product [Sympodiomycopsis kandeliae]